MIRAALAIVEPGQRDWFPASDWKPDAYLYENESEVWFSLLWARKPRSGAFSRLLAAVEAQGRRVIVPFPLGNMREILTRRDFVPFGDGTWRRP
jgi:hypothetical protein